MAYIYEKTITDPNTGITKTIKGNSRQEMDLKEKSQFDTWNIQETRRRKTAEIANGKDRAAYRTALAKAEIEAHRNILQSTLKVDDRLDWDKMMDRTPYPPFEFIEPKPTLDKSETGIQVPKPSPTLEKIFPSLKAKRLDREKQEQAALQQRQDTYKEAKRLYQESRHKAQEHYDKMVILHRTKLLAHNAEIIEFQKAYERQDKDAVERYILLVLANSVYTASIPRQFEVVYQDTTKTLVIDSYLPCPTDVPTLLEVRYVASRNETTEISMKPKDAEAYYELIVQQITLRTLHEIYESDYIHSIDMVVLNGWVKGVNAKTGHDFTSCIISVQATREQIVTLNLERVDPKECLRSLKALSAGPLAQLAPVKPILELDRHDSRFVESRDVLATVEEGSNLATMEWEDFEHLVRELFAKEFSVEGGEVRVTRASRDGGVDAIAFDPDPIRGGKFVIQAKRYNNVVPVSAIRDLYGTVINEGATKGIIVTTSYYGNDSREFAKDKPLTLIDGANLIHLLSKHGYMAFIEINRGA